MKLKKLVIATALTASLTAQSAFALGDAIRTVDGIVGGVLGTATIIVSAPFLATGWTTKKTFYGKELLVAKDAANKHLTNLQRSKYEQMTLTRAWKILGDEIIDEEIQETAYSAIEKRCHQNGAISIQTCVERSLSLIVSHLVEIQ